MGGGGQTLRSLLQMGEICLRTAFKVQGYMDYGQTAKTSQRGFYGLTGVYLGCVFPRQGLNNIHQRGNSVVKNDY